MAMVSQALNYYLIYKTDLLPINTFESRKLKASSILTRKKQKLKKSKLWFMKRMILTMIEMYIYEIYIGSTLLARR